MEYFIDCRRFTSRETLHRVFAQVLPFPEHYGSNLDALHDCLTDLTCTIHLQNWDQNALGSYALPLKKVLLAAMKHNPGLTLLFE